MKFKFLVFFLFLTFISSDLIPISTKCAQNYYFNPNSMTCAECPSNAIGNWTQCLCRPGYKSNSTNILTMDFSCTLIGSNCASPNIYNQYDTSGNRIDPPGCLQCKDKSIPNSNSSACIPCGPGSKPNSNNSSCICEIEGGGFVLDSTGCYNLTGHSYSITSSYISYLPRNIKGCYDNNASQHECSALMNICLYSLFEDEICTELFTNGYLTQQASTYTSTSQASSSNSLNLTLMKYLPTGGYHSLKTFEMTDILYCESLSSNNFKIGNNYEQECLFSFNNALQMMDSLRDDKKGFTYSLFLTNDNSSYLIPVQATINGNKKIASRFFTTDLFSVPLTQALTVMTSFNLQITLNSQGRLSSPKINVEYSKLYLGSNGVLSNPIQTVKYSINYNYQVGTFNTVALAVFIVLTVIAIVQAIIRTYIAHLNKRSPLLFFVFFGENWTSWMFVALLGLSGYWLFFTKATPQLYVLMPASGELYSYFIGIVAAMVIVRTLTVIAIKYNTFKTDIFLIDWEVSPFKNCWRQVFIANSLSQFFTFRTISFGWILIWTAFFLVGLGWEQQSNISTSFRSWTPFSTMNEILLFFIGCSVLFLVGIIFKILRRVVFTWWPHPFDDFVDFCCLANISVYFPSRNSPTGFYIHGNNVNGSQISLMELNDAILKGNLRKTNSLFNPGVSNSESSTFILYSNNDLENKLQQLRRQDQQLAYDAGKKKGYIQLFKNRQKFINNDLKTLFLNLPKQRNQLLVRSTIQQYLGIPPIDLHAKRNQIALAADASSNIQSIFPNGDQFGDILTYCILFGGLNVALKSSSIAAFLTYFILEWIVQSIVGKAARVHIQYCTKVKQGFML